MWHKAIVKKFYCVSFFQWWLANIEHKYSPCEIRDVPTSLCHHFYDLYLKNHCFWSAFMIVFITLCYNAFNKKSHVETLFISISIKICKICFSWYHLVFRYNFHMICVKFVALCKHLILINSVHIIEHDTH